MSFISEKQQKIILNFSLDSLFQNNMIMEYQKILDLLNDANDSKFVIRKWNIVNSGVLIDGVTETISHEIKKQEGRFLGAFLAHLAASLVQLVISSVVKGISGRGVRRAGRGYMNKNF